MLTQQGLQQTTYKDQILDLFSNSYKNFINLNKKFKLLEEQEEIIEQQEYQKKYSKLKNQINTMRDLELQSIYASIYDNPHRHKNLTQPLYYNVFDDGGSGANFFKPVFNFFKSLVDPAPGGLVHAIVTVVNQLRIYFNPKVDLLPEEQKFSVHSELFIAAATVNSSFNKIYRDLIKIKVSPEQILHSFLKSINDPRLVKDLKQRHKLFKLAEKKLLQADSSNSIKLDDLPELINNNLSKVVVMHQAKLDLQVNSIQDRIDAVTTIVQRLVEQIKLQQTQLQELNFKQSKVDQSKKLQLYRLMQYNKLKLYNFWLKTSAWTKMQLLSPNRSCNFESYIVSKFASFPCNLNQDLKTTVNNADLARDVLGASLGRGLFSCFVKNHEGQLELSNTDEFKQVVGQINQARYHELAEKFRSLLDFREDLLRIKHSIAKSIKVDRGKQHSTMIIAENYINELVQEFEFNLKSQNLIADLDLNNPNQLQNAELTKNWTEGLEGNQQLFAKYQELNSKLNQLTKEQIKLKSSFDEYWKEFVFSRPSNQLRSIV